MKFLLWLFLVSTSGLLCNSKFKWRQTYQLYITFILNFRLWTGFQTISFHSLCESCYIQHPRSTEANTTNLSKNAADTGLTLVLVPIHALKNRWMVKFIVNPRMIHTGTVTFSVKIVGNQMYWIYFFNLTFNETE